MTVKELIEKLSTFPEDAIVECLEEYSRSWETGTEWIEVTDDDIYFTDFRDRTEGSYAGKCVVEIGSK